MTRLKLYTAIILLIFATIGVTIHIEREAEKDRFFVDWCTNKLAPDYSTPELKKIKLQLAISCLQGIYH